VNFVSPRDGATDVAISARIGITLDELIEMGTVFEGSFHLREMGSDRPLAGTYSGQEGLISFSPARPLRPETTYEVIVPAGGIRDYSGNAVETAFRSTFTTVRCD
jgi:hypothetical protein